MNLEFINPFFSIPFLFLTGGGLLIFGFFGSIFNAAKSLFGAITGSGGTKTSSRSKYEDMYRQSEQKVFQLQTQLAQRKDVPWIPIALIGGISLIAIVFLKK